LTHAAEAMDYHYDVIKGRLMLRGDGDIEVDEGKRFLAFTADLPAHLFAMFDGKATLVLDSRGGNLAAGFVLAHIVWSFHLTTDVSYAGQCASACVVAWAAGAHKQMENTRASGPSGLSQRDCDRGRGRSHRRAPVHPHHGEMVPHQRRP
jgi:hypothetical protein